MKVAVVRNRNHDGVLGKLGSPCLERYGRRSVQSVMNALRTAGHNVEVFEGDINLLSNLAEFMPVNPETGVPGGMVFNMAYGIQGQARYTHVPAMLEMAGVPYTGPGPQAHAVALDKILTKLLMERYGIPTPKFQMMANPFEDVDGLCYPLIVKPRCESTSLGINIVHNPGDLKQAVELVVEEFKQEALVEEYIDGTEVAVCLLGNSPIEVLPLVEIDFRNRDVKIMTKPDKFHRSGEAEPLKICPARLGIEQTTHLQKIAVATFQLCQCRDYARLDLRLDHDGNPYVLEINSMATLGQKGGFVLAARKIGYTFKELICRILDVAHERYFGRPAPRGFDLKTSPIKSVPRRNCAISPKISSKTCRGE